MNYYDLSLSQLITTLSYRGGNFGIAVGSGVHEYFRVFHTWFLYRLNEIPMATRFRCQAIQRDQLECCTMTPEVGNPIWRPVNRKYTYLSL